jgi:hypothetical protein
MINQKADISVKAFAYYKSQWNPTDNPYTPIAGHLIINVKKVKMPFIRVKDFLQDVYEEKYADIKNKITIFFKAIYDGIPASKVDAKENAKRKYLSCVETKKFVYGFDELFLNLYFMPVLKEYTHLVYIEMNLDTLKFIPGVDKRIFEPAIKIKNILYHSKDVNTSRKFHYEFKKEIHKIYNYLVNYFYTHKNQPMSKEVEKALQFYEKYKIPSFIPFFPTGTMIKVPGI